METRASYVLVGSFALVFVIGIVGALLWISGKTGEERLVYFDILFEGSVAGLRPGNPVNYRGVPIGQVIHMMIDPEDINKIRVTIDVPETTPVKEDTIARLQYQGITGVAFVNLGGGTQEAPMMVAGSSQRGEKTPSSTRKSPAFRKCSSRRRNWSAALLPWSTMQTTRCATKTKRPSRIS